MSNQVQHMELTPSEGDPRLCDFYILYAKHLDADENLLFTLYLGYDSGTVFLTRDKNEAVCFGDYDKAVEIQNGLMKSAGKAMQTAAELGAPRPASVITGVEGFVCKQTVH